MTIPPPISKEFINSNQTVKNTSKDLNLDNINKYRDEIDVNKHKIG